MMRFATCCTSSAVIARIAAIVWSTV